MIKNKDSDICFYGQKEECAICLCNLKSNNGHFLSCGHKFHKKCISNLLAFSCPCCRAEIKKDDVPSKVFKKMESNSRKNIFPLLSAIGEEFGIEMTYFYSQIQT